MAELNVRLKMRSKPAAEWTEADVLLKGELGFDTTNKLFKMGDGTTPWTKLEAFYDSQEITGEVSADNAYFTKDFTFTYQFGKYAPDSSGSVTVPAAEKSVTDFLNGAFAEEKNPKITQPSCSVTLTGAGSLEVGTEFTPKWSVGFNKGKYEYGPTDTGVVVSTYAVTDTNSGSADTASGSFEKFTVDESTNYTVSVTVSYGDGAIPLTNLGNEYADGQIKAGSKNASSSAVKGYRGWFYGYYNGSQAIPDATQITSAQLRAFGVKTSFPTSLSTNQMQQMFFAAPQGKVTSVKVANSVNGAPQTVNKTTINVEGANGFEAIPYDVFYVSNAVAESGASTFTITTAKA